VFIWGPLPRKKAKDMVSNISFVSPVPHIG